jgi:hypothetical protein
LKMAIVFGRKLLGRNIWKMEGLPSLRKTIRIPVCRMMCWKLNISTWRAEIQLLKMGKYKLLVW